MHMAMVSMLSIAESMMTGDASEPASEFRVQCPKVNLSRLDSRLTWWRGHRLSLRELAETAAQVTGVTIPPVLVPVAVAQLGAWMLSARDR